MTKNLAGRGEGLKERIAELWREASIGEHIHTTETERMDYCRICWSRGAARNSIMDLMPEILAALEAAAPAGTAHDVHWAIKAQCAHCVDSYPQRQAGDGYIALECPVKGISCDAPCKDYPKCPQPPSEDTSWRWLRLRGYLRQWLTPHHFEIAMDCLDKAEAPPDVQLIEHEATMAEHNSHIEFENELYATLVDPVAEGSIKEADMRKQLLESARWYRQHVHDLENQLNQAQRVPAAIQEPAGSGARPPAEGISAEEWREYNDKVAASRRQK